MFCFPPDSPVLSCNLPALDIALFGLPFSLTSPSSRLPSPPKLPTRLGGDFRNRLRRRSKAPQR